jgi:hypothetical protein
MLLIRLLPKRALAKLEESPFSIVSCERRRGLPLRCPLLKPLG